MEKSTKSEELSRRRLKTESMSDRTLPNSDNESERRAPLPKNLVRSQSFEMESPEMRNKLDLQGRTQRRMKSVSMPEKTLQNMATGIGKRASIPTTMLRSQSARGNPDELIWHEDTIDEESRDELGRAINARPISREIRNLEDTIDEESRDELGQAINARPISREIRNQEDTIDEESRDELGQAINARPISREIRNQELGQAIKARPLSNEIRNPECMPRAGPIIQCSGMERREDRSSQNMNQSMPKTSYGSPHSAIGKRGYVLVIINYKFGGKYSELPDGTNDLKEIKNLFCRPSYMVVGLFNQSKNGILDTIKELASKEDSTRFICFLSSHGDNTSLVCPRNDYGEEHVKIRDVLQCANTPQLKDCPKIFFIDACRTGKDKIMRSEDFPEPPGRGYYVGFSCLHQMTSEWPIGGKSCGLYFNALIEVFKDSFSRPATERRKIRDLHDLMEKVHHYLSKQTRNGQPIQTPVCKSTLSGKVFLHGHE